MFSCLVNNYRVDQNDKPSILHRIPFVHSLFIGILFAIQAFIITDFLAKQDVAVEGELI